VLCCGTHVQHDREQLGHMLGILDDLAADWASEVCARSIAPPCRAVPCAVPCAVLCAVPCRVPCSVPCSALCRALCRTVLCAVQCSLDIAAQHRAPCEDDALRCAVTRCAALRCDAGASEDQRPRGVCPLYRGGVLPRRDQGVCAGEGTRVHQDGGERAQVRGGARERESERWPSCC
jgi:hypothetical protein